MNKNTKSLLTAIFSIFLLTMMGKAQPPSTVINNLQTAVVRVHSGSRIGSGFLWNSNRWVVTTLHLIEDEANIEVTLSNDVKDAKVLKILKEHDLVLLELDPPSSDCYILQQVNANPATNSNLYTMGYNGNGNINSIIDRTLRLGFHSNGTLSGLLPKNIRDALNTCKRPNPAIPILYLDGTLLPGFSGAPIIDNNGHLVGIADGGLEEGASSISWGIKANMLKSLSESLEPFPDFITCGDGNSVTFSAENILDDRNVEYINYKQFRFIKTKSRTVQEMVATIDDPEGLYQIINAYSMSINNVNFYDFRYDIYEDINSGLTFCVPEGTNLNIENDLIVGNFDNEDYKVIMYPDQVQFLNPDPTLRYVASANTFQQKIVNIDGGMLTYQKDYNLSYPNGPIIRYDGIKVNREAYRGFRIVTDFYGQQMLEPATYSFQTHIGRGNMYMGAAALNMNSVTENTMILSDCITSEQCNNPHRSAECERECNAYRLFSQIVIGVHMGGFSNNYNRN